MPHAVKMKPRESHILEDRREGDGEETKPTSRSKLGAGVLPMRVGVTDFGPSEPAALRSGVVVL